MRAVWRLAACSAAFLGLAGCGGGTAEDTPATVPSPAASSEPDEAAGFLGAIVHPATGPCGVTQDPDSGRVWVSYANTREVVEVDPTTGARVATFGLEGTRPCGLQYIDGWLWVGVLRDNVVQQVDPETGEVAAEIPLTGGAFGMLEAFGDLWVLDGTAPAVVRIDTATATIADTIRIEGTPRSMVATDEGIWVVRETPGVVTLLTPEPLAIAEEVEVVPGIRGIAVGDGALWVTRARLGTVHRIDLADRSVGPPITVGEDPRAISFAHGYVWAADVNGQLAQIDPTTRQVAAVHPFAVGIGGALPVGDHLWVFEPNRIVRVDPAVMGGAGS